MPWRLHDSVVCGEIDNRIKGIVRGSIWLEGGSQPIALELRGNAHPDLAGCLATLTTRRRPIWDPRLLDEIHPLQIGTVGDLTGSRRESIWDMPAELTPDVLLSENTTPEQLSNGVYLEWFSDANGRVVIEGSDLEIALSPPEWKPTPEEDRQRAHEVAAAMERVLQRLTEAIQVHQIGRKDPAVEWDEHDYERMLRESDARADKFHELVDKYGDLRDVDEIIARHMGWDRNYVSPCRRGKPITLLDLLHSETWEKPANEPDPLGEGIDWIWVSAQKARHPLQQLCCESGREFSDAVERLGRQHLRDKAVNYFLYEFAAMCPQVGHAYDGLAAGCGHHDNALTVAYLKRALGHLDRAQAELVKVAPRDSLFETLIASMREETFEVRRAILDQIHHFRQRTRSG